MAGFSRFVMSHCFKYSRTVRAETTSLGGISTQRSNLGQAILRSCYPLRVLLGITHEGKDFVKGGSSSIQLLIPKVEFSPFYQGTIDKPRSSNLACYFDTFLDTGIGPAVISLSPYSTS